MKRESCKDNKVYGYKIKTVSDKKMSGYMGMNYFAGKAMGFTPLIKDKKEIIVNKIYKGETKRRIIKHEIHEAELMKKGHTYFYAHRKANVAEKKSYLRIKK